MASMRSITLSSSLSTTSSAPMFSDTCSALEAPVITVLTPSNFRHQASASYAMLQPSSPAIGISCLTLSMRAWPSSLSMPSRMNL